MNSNEPTQDYDRNPFMFSPSQSASGEGEKEGGEKTVKKRTKTGCLTCRLRRIKCDEGKPECNNCKKSKRQCGGNCSDLAVELARRVLIHRIRSKTKQRGITRQREEVEAIQSIRRQGHYSYI